MFLILVDGQAKGLCDKPNYVRKKNGIWIDGTENDHEAIAIGGVAYEGAVAKESDSGEYVFNMSKDVERNGSDISESQASIVDLEISGAESESAIVDLEIAVAELKQRIGG